MPPVRHIRSLLLKSKKGTTFTLETDLFNYEIAQQFKGCHIEGERSLREGVTEGADDNDD